MNMNNDCVVAEEVKEKVKVEKIIINLYDFIDELTYSLSNCLVNKNGKEHKLSNDDLNLLLGYFLDFSIVICDFSKKHYIDENKLKLIIDKYTKALETVKNFLSKLGYDSQSADVSYWIASEASKLKSIIRPSVLNAINIDVEKIDAISCIHYEITNKLLFSVVLDVTLLE